MYTILTVNEDVRIPPKDFNKDLKEVIATELENKLIGKMNKACGAIIAVTGVKEIGEGRVIFGDGAIHYNVNSDILVYKPELHELVEGCVTEITDFGAFISIGPMEGLVHISQIMNDYMNYDAKNMMLVEKEGKKKLKIGDDIRARIISVSIKGDVSNSKIGLTMRQPYLGKAEWLAAKEEEKTKEKKTDKDKSKAKEAKEAKKESKK